MVKIEFFNKGKSLGAFPLKDHSNQDDRQMVANVNGIEEFDRFILDDGRVECWIDERTHFISDGKVWICENNGEQ